MFRIHVGAVWPGKINVFHVPDTCWVRFAGKNECFSCSGCFGRGALVPGWGRLIREGVSKPHFPFENALQGASGAIFRHHEFWRKIHVPDPCSGSRPWLLVSVLQVRMNVFHIPDTCWVRFAGKNEHFSCSGCFGRRTLVPGWGRPILWGYQSLMSLSKTPSRVPLEPFFGTMNCGRKFMFRIHVPVHGLGCWCPFCK